MSFALTQRTANPTQQKVLLLLDSRPEAEDIADEMRRKGHRVDIYEASQERPSLILRGPLATDPSATNRKTP